MKGRDFTVRKPHPALPKEFYRTLTTGIILLIPMLAIGISRKSIKSMVKQSNLDYFRISYREPDCLRTKVYLQIERLKTAMGKKLLSWLPLVTRTKDKVTTRLNDVNNTDLGARTFRGINAFFNDIKKQAANREYEKVLRSYQEMEKLVTRELDVIASPYMISNSASRNGGAILFLTTFARVRLPMISLPFFSVSTRRTSMRTEA